MPKVHHKGGGWKEVAHGAVTPFDDNQLYGAVIAFDY